MKFLLFLVPRVLALVCLASVLAPWRAASSAARSMLGSLVEEAEFLDFMKGLLESAEKDGEGRALVRLIETFLAEGSLLE